MLEINIVKEPNLNPRMKKTETIATDLSISPMREPMQPAQTRQFDEVVERATEVLENRQKALRWLGTPVRALEYATPISLLHSPEGQRAVLEVLDRIEYGVI
jgi:putative toxin-antitoxin system antitoxin component (TIGR02293 family)